MFSDANIFNFDCTIIKLNGNLGWALKWSVLAMVPSFGNNKQAIVDFLTVVSQLDWRITYRRHKHISPSLPLCDHAQPLLTKENQGKSDFSILLYVTLKVNTMKESILITNFEFSRICPSYMTRLISLNNYQQSSSFKKKFLLHVITSFVAYYLAPECYGEALSNT